MLFPFTAGLRIILAGEYLGQRHYILHPKKFFLQSLITFYPVEEIFFSSQVISPAKYLSISSLILGYSINKA